MHFVSLSVANNTRPYHFILRSANRTQREHKYIFEKGSLTGTFVYPFRSLRMCAFARNILTV